MKLITSGRYCKYLAIFHLAAIHENLFSDRNLISCYSYDFFDERLIFGTISIILLHEPKIVLLKQGIVFRA
ncbi:MAG: hypothetical protein PHO65_07025, partial [Sulfurovum sp.]|nr:hypothetical protein [Sulfurovum sp.]